MKIVQLSVTYITLFRTSLRFLTCSPMYDDEPGTSYVSWDVLVSGLDVSLHFEIQLTLVYPHRLRCVH